MVKIKVANKQRKIKEFYKVLSMLLLRSFTKFVVFFLLRGSSILIILVNAVRTIKTNIIKERLKAGSSSKNSLF